MRSYIPDYDLQTPATLAEALALLASEPGRWRPIAGGTDVMVALEAGKLAHREFVSLWGLKELRGIQVTEDFLTLGALTTYTEVRRSEAMAIEYSLLAQAARETGGVATQNRGTLGGNIANASPAADSPPALLVYDAELELVGAQGSRWVPYAGFHNGYKQMLLAAGEIVARIRLPRRAGLWREYFRKVGTRKAQAISKVCVAAALRIEDGVVAQARIAVGSLAPVPLRCRRTEAVLQGKALSRLTIDEALREFDAEIAPIGDIRSTEPYRRRVARNLLEEFLIVP